jgi:WD40 repeat protein/serine/threonine protein kinase/tetratricopeptide (TPR) repeat protein
MSASREERNPVELLAEEFLERKRRGERPTLREYVERHPELAVEIRDLFPALLMMEDLGDSSGATTGSLAAAEGAAIGTKLARLGDYRILREIGRGGMGVVYEAEQESLGRRVALKVLSASALLDPKQVRRFEREAKAAARLHHTNIVPVFGVGHQDGHHYFVMQFIAGLGLDAVLEDLRRLRHGKSAESSPPLRGGSDLAEPRATFSAASPITGLTAANVARSLVTGRFPADGPLGDGSLTEPRDDGEAGGASDSPPVSSPPAPADSSPPMLPGSSALRASSDPDCQFFRSVARIGIQVAEALDYANRQGILHRDVKPSNLLLDNRGNVWVADFGLAKTAETDDLTHTGDILGTIRYMAPERFSGHCDARSDVYSLGLTLYELVALRPAHEAADRHALFERVLHEEPQRLKKLAPAVPHDLETIIAKASARDPVGRYATAAALAEDLKRFVEDRPIQARRTSAAERLVRWCRRNKVLAVTIGLATGSLVAAVIAALLYAVEQAHRANDRALYAEKQSEAAASYKAALSESNRRLAMLDLERGRIAFERGQIGVGMLWTVESLRMAIEAENPTWRRVALANLSAWRRQLPELKAICSHGVAVNAVTFSPDAKLILTGSEDGTARLWDAATGRPIEPAMIHRDSVCGVAFSPDGKIILTGSSDHTARLWDAATGRPIGQPLAHNGHVHGVAFGHDGKAVLAGGDAGARLWDVATGRPIGALIAHGELVGAVALNPDLIAHGDLVGAVALSPDGRTILTGSSDRTARLWDAATSRPIGPPMAHQGEVWGVAFSPDGKTILTAGSDRTARLWDAATGRPVSPPLTHSHEVRAVAFSPDGRTILTGCYDRTVQLWDAAAGERLGTTLEHPGRVSSVAFSPDGRSILTGGDDGTVRLWALEPGQPVGQPLSDDFPRFSPDGKALWARDNAGKLMVWDLVSGQPVGRPVKLGSGVLDADWSPDSRSIVTGCLDKSARRWDAATGQPIGPPLPHRRAVWKVAFSPEGKTILTGCRDGTAHLWDATTSRPIGQPIEHGAILESIAFGPNGKTCLTVGGDNTARLWDAATARAIGQPMRHPDRMTSWAFSPDGRTLLTACLDRAARRWDAATGQPLAPPLLHPGAVWKVAFGPDGRTILTGTQSPDGTARLWDTASGQPIGPLMAHPAGVSGVAFSKDGKTILTGCTDNMARLWDVDTGQLIGPPLTHAPTFPFWVDVEFGPDGRYLLTRRYGYAARLWDAPEPLPDDPARLAAWVAAVTGLELDERGSVRVLDHDAWQERRRRLRQLGGPPPPDRAPRLDPMLYNDEPPPRGDAFAERGLWAEAEAACLEAVRARPLDASWRADSAWAALTRFHISQGRPERAVAELGAAVSRCPDVLGLRFWHCHALLAAGDRVGWERAIAGLLDRFPGPMHPAWGDADAVAWTCALAPYPLADPAVPVRLAEEAIRNATEYGFSFEGRGFLNTLGAVLYRAGRFDDAIRCLEEAIQSRSGASEPQDCAFLAMAHHRLGHRAEARRWIERLRDHQPSADPIRFWDELEIRVLRSEAEAVVLYDPSFPHDPFAP